MVGVSDGGAEDPPMTGGAPPAPAPVMVEPAGESGNSGPRVSTCLIIPRARPATTVTTDMTWARHQQVPGPRLAVIPWQAWPARGSGGADAGGLRALRALGYLELHVLVLLQAAEAVAVNLGVVHEDVRSVGAGDDAVALLRVQPLDGSLRHVAPCS